MPIGQKNSAPKYFCQTRVLSRSLHAAVTLTFDDARLRNSKMIVSRALLAWGWQNNGVGMFFHASGEGVLKRIEGIMDGEAYYRIAIKWDHE